MDRPATLLDILSKNGLLGIESDVIEIPASNEPGILFQISSILARHKVNVEYGYGSTGSTGSVERIFLQASDNEKALKALKEEMKNTAAK